MKDINSILCVVGKETRADSAIAQSVTLAKDHQATLSFLCLLDEEPAWTLPFVDAELLRTSFAELAESMKFNVEQYVLEIDPAIEFDVEVRTGTAFIEVIRRVQAQQHDLVIKCADDTDWLDRMFGSNDMHILRKCPCPVLMLKPGKVDAFRSVLATVDVNDESNPEHRATQSDLNRQVLHYSANLCMAQLSELHVVNVWRAYAERFLRDSAFSRSSPEEIDAYVEQKEASYSSELESIVAELRDGLGEETMRYLSLQKHLVKGVASKEIPRMTQELDIDLIVMGTVGRTGVPGLIIGNTAESILEQVQCSVLAIKPKGFVSPVE